MIAVTLGELLDVDGRHDAMNLSRPPAQVPK
jgi:hypothetical protein